MCKVLPQEAFILLFVGPAAKNQLLSCQEIFAAGKLARYLTDSPEAGPVPS
jgi:hypothetical protein